MFKVGENERELLDASVKAMQNALVLWGFKVGAAVIAEDGRVYEGCNIESWVSGLGVCAERCAIDHALLHGNRKIEEIAIVMEARANRVPRPCGSCLQYISDFAANRRIKIVTARVERQKVLNETVNIRTLDKLLPFAYKKQKIS
jgi:cytidine deaminase